MYRIFNPNPVRRSTNDCVLRAICKIFGLDWVTAHDQIAAESRAKYDTMDANHVWIGWLMKQWYRLYPIPYTCHDCYTVRDFCREHPTGEYILGTGSHVVAVIDGDWYDSFDSGDMVPTFYMRRI